ncbi:hypothetical protein ALC53_06395 [Atta colombica]|uniref:Uncharacterized protein n=1 Tax=Atta colombica TaxID=520822 RepID=A0A195BEX5_9HYME|nr:hypothetical protein ALC53_06395 [Atta colombica]
MSPAGVSGTPDTVDEACRGGTMSRIQYLSSSTTLDLHVHMGGDRRRTRRFGRKKKTERDQNIVYAKIKVQEAPVSPASSSLSNQNQNENEQVLLATMQPVNVLDLHEPPVVHTLHPKYHHHHHRHHHHHHHHHHQQQQHIQGNDSEDVQQRAAAADDSDGRVSPGTEVAAAAAGNTTLGVGYNCIMFKSDRKNRRELQSLIIKLSDITEPIAATEQIACHTGRILNSGMSTRMIFASHYRMYNKRARPDITVAADASGYSFT